MFIKIGGSPESQGSIISAGFKPEETKTITDKVVRCVDRRGNIPEIRYQTNDGRAYVSGYSVNPEEFHICFVVNNERREGKFRNLINVFHKSIQDLKQSGIKQISVNCIPKLVPIAMKRYGFQTYDGKRLEELMKKTGDFPLTALVKKF